MSKIVRQTSIARRDLIDILDYLERTAGSETADRFFVGATATFERLAHYPRSGRSIAFQSSELD